MCNLHVREELLLLDQHACENKMCWSVVWQRSFFYTSRAGLFFMWGVSLTHPMLTLFVCGEFVLHNPCCLHFYACSFSYTSHAGFIFMPARSFCYACLLHFVFFSSFFSLIFFICFYIIIWGVSLTQPALVSFFSFSFYRGSFSYTSRAGFLFLSLFIGGVSLTHPMLVSFLSGWGVSLTHPVLASFLFGKFLLYIPCWL